MHDIEGSLFILSFCKQDNNYMIYMFIIYFMVLI